MAPWTFIRTCGAVGLACAAWNLFGDLYYLDFYTAHLSNQEMGMIRDDLQAGYLFQFTNSNWWVVFIAQSGGWMYPIWAFVTAVPLYMGLLQREDDNNYNNSSRIFWRQAAPCALLTYGLCVVGGALHNGFVFITVLPSVYHFAPEVANGWSDLAGTEEFSLFLKTAQTRILQHIMVGSLPGYVACNVAALWIAVIVHSGNTRFPKSFNFFNPIVTIFWIQILGALLPDSWGFYLVGCLGTWGLLVFNAGTIYYLWNDGTGPESLSSHLLSTQSAHMDYKSVHRGIIS